MIPENTAIHKLADTHNRIHTGYAQQINSLAQDDQIKKEDGRKPSSSKFDSKYSI